MNPPSVPSSSKLPENNIEACEQAGTLARAARRAVSRVIEAITHEHVKGYRTTSDEVWDRSPICRGCNHAWPCDTAVLAADLSRLRETNAERQSIVGELMEQRDEAEALASRLREERDALTHDRDQARDEADNWRQQAWMEGYPRDSGDRHPWETSDEYRDLLAAGWASPTPRISPEATS